MCASVKRWTQTNRKQVLNGGWFMLTIIILSFGTIVRLCPKPPHHPPSSAPFSTVLRFWSWRLAVLIFNLDCFLCFSVLFGDPVWSSIVGKPVRWNWTYWNSEACCIVLQADAPFWIGVKTQQSRGQSHTYCVGGNNGHVYFKAALTLRFNLLLLFCIWVKNGCVR